MESNIEKYAVFDRKQIQDDLVKENLSVEKFKNPPTSKSKENEAILNNLLCLSLSTRIQNIFYAIQYVVSVEANSKVDYYLFEMSQFGKMPTQKHRKVTLPRNIKTSSQN